MKTIKKAALGAVSFIIITVFCAVSVYAIPEEVYLGGVPFGVKIMSGELTATGFSEVETENGGVCPALDAGLEEGDVILSVGGRRVTSAGELSDALGKTRGETTAFVCRRGDTEITLQVTPVKAPDGSYKAGVLIKDGTCGIGTVTFIIPHTMAFAGLGHGICDRETGKTEAVAGGAVFPVEIKSVDRGSEGRPGALIGEFKDEKTGTLISNTPEGVYGLFANAPSSLADGDLIETAPLKDAVKGDAEIKCTLNGKEAKLYGVRITDIDEDEETNRNFVIEITDEELLRDAGGIVQGMSGSPIIQNGKLIGAVTHVFVGDPKTGYGISVENMMESLPEILR